MAYTVTKLITRAYYLAGIVAPNLQVVTGDQLADGLDLLNALLSVKSANIRLIPYFKKYSLTAVVGQEIYFVPNLVSLETFTFTINTVRYQMFSKSRKKYFGSNRANQIQSLPFDWHIERTLGGSNLYVYFLPDAAYPMEIWGKFSLDQVTLNEDLTTIYDAFYIEYLRYALGAQIAAEYNAVLQPQSEKRLMELEKILMDISPPDLTMQKLSSLQDNNTSINYAYVNLNTGWSP